MTIKTSCYLFIVCYTLFSGDCIYAENSAEIFHKERLSSFIKNRYNVGDFEKPEPLVSVSHSGNNASVAFDRQTPGVLDEKSNTSSANKLITLNFQSIPLRAVLQLLADFTGINMVVSDTVSGSISLRLHQVPWEEALDVILKTKSLDRYMKGDVMMITPRKEYLKERRAEARARLLGNPVKNLTKHPVLESELIQIKYAHAVDIANLLKDKSSFLLSNYGSINVDARTNTLWVHDTVKHLALIKQMIKARDVPSKQVLIEARIVEVNKEFARDLGISWGISGLASKHLAVSGTSKSASKILASGEARSIPLAERLHVDFAALPLAGHAASIGLALAKLGDDILLDLELSAMESEGRGEIIASPRLITMNLQPALIQSGEEVPYQEATSSGATSTSFKKAVLSLQVTPEVTADRKIKMELQINQDRLSSQKYNGVPAIMTKEIKTFVIVNHGQTIVLGGIYKEEHGTSVERVPFLGKLPLIGGAFRKENRTKTNEELLIFITPKIINEDE